MQRLKFSSLRSYNEVKSYFIHAANFFRNFPKADCLKISRIKTNESTPYIDLCRCRRSLRNLYDNKSFQGRLPAWCLPTSWRNSAAAPIHDTQQMKYSDEIIWRNYQVVSSAEMFSINWKVYWQRKAEGLSAVLAPKKSSEGHEFLKTSNTRFAWTTFTGFRRLETDEFRGHLNHFRAIFKYRKQSLNLLIPGRTLFESAPSSGILDIQWRSNLIRRISYFCPKRSTLGNRRADCFKPSCMSVFRSSLTNFSMKISE